MASRPVWEGQLRLSLVACPVRLFKATGEGDAVTSTCCTDRRSTGSSSSIVPPRTASSSAATWSRAMRSSATATWWSRTKS